MKSSAQSSALRNYHEGHCESKLTVKRYEAYQEIHPRKTESADTTNERISSWETTENRAVSKWLQNKYFKRCSKR